MLIIGAKGFAKEVLEVLHQRKELSNIVFFDDVNTDIPEKLYFKYDVLSSLQSVEQYFTGYDNRFTIGIGNPILRKKMYEKFIKIGGEFTSVISPFAQIGHYGNTIEIGCNIMTGSVITNNIFIKKGTLINLNCTVGHDSTIGCFVELSPGVHISGNCSIGDYTSVGTNATILPNISIGKNVTIGAGSVITKDIPDDCLVIGVPGKIIKKTPSISF
ncbi:acetyltransferase [Lutibacter sp.]